MNNSIDLILTILCVSIPVGILVVSAVLGIRARRRYANELQSKLDKGYFNNWSSSLITSRLKIVAVIQVIALLGVLVDLLLWFYYQSQVMRIAIACVLGVLAVILVITGLLRMKWLKNVNSH